MSHRLPKWPVQCSFPCAPPLHFLFFSCSELRTYFNGCPGVGERVVAVLYTDVFDQIVVVGQRFVTTVDLHTGIVACKFRVATSESLSQPSIPFRALVTPSSQHPLPLSEVPATSATLDSESRLLLVGGHDGSLNVWNFNTGKCFVKYGRRSAEVGRYFFFPLRFVMTLAARDSSRV